MRIFLSISCLLICLQVYGQKNAWKNKSEARWENFENGTRLLASNDNLLPVTYIVDVKIKNLKQSVSNGTLVVIPPGASDSVVFEFIKIDPKKGWDVKNNTLSYYGDLSDTEYDADYVYDLPFENGASFKVAQGYGGTISHQNKFAIDFNTPVNTTVHAAREGLVVEVVENNVRSCDQPSCADFNNYVKILHSDGTIMQYLHLKRNGSAVKAGEMVNKGDLIGYSGNTGWSTGPHLHIDLYLTGKDNKYQTLKTKFKIQKGEISEELIKGEIYTKDY
ncbi:M23 family metallopeptidase [Nonlabens marinus]|uniref:Peptidase, M23/M37 family n=1 Tax=Nonlabens marinus S1-08 TaxID=1454201 RepID=W8VPJ3_9FLAO|nr:M23 family metallopeptidase [Nonlabens marinus]BAO55079.1 peptidase, M23/M37 family [Nonlabens marinus S1-08]